MIKITPMFTLFFKDKNSDHQHDKLYWQSEDVPLSGGRLRSRTHLNPQTGSESPRRLALELRFGVNYTSCISVIIRDNAFLESSCPEMIMNNGENIPFKILPTIGNAIKYSLRRRKVRDHPQ